MDNVNHPYLAQSVDISTDGVFDFLDIDDFLFSFCSPFFWEW
ncbi:hypothetical protein GCM10007417_29110 [Glycocaulis alkaliphilus]|nr:hypothetical protein GCM10007417_29110 [Glycocaulis alkaliphilus]